MSGQDHRGLRASGFFNSLIGSLRRNVTPRQEPSPEPEDLGLKTLRQVYSRCSDIINPVDRERQICKILPLFCANCLQYKGQLLVTKFPEVYEFAEDVSKVFVSHVRQSAQVSNMASRALSIFKYFDPCEDQELCGTGYTILKVVKILSEGPESLIDVVMNQGVCSVLVQCVSLFLELPPPCGSSGQASPFHYGSPGDPTIVSTTSQRTTPTYGHRQTSPPPSPDSSLNVKAEPTVIEVAERQALEHLIGVVLNKLLRFSSTVKNLLKEGNLSLLFGAISTPCPHYNKVWRKCASRSLIAVCRYSLSSDVIKFIHCNGSIKFCIHNLSSSMDQPPLEVVEIIATIFCCLKDSSDFSQVLMDDFSSSQGYKLLYDYLLHLETSSHHDAKEAERNLVLLIQNLTMAGFHTLEPSLTDGGPFQDPSFSIPAPLHQGSTIRNVLAFIVLKDAFLSSRTTSLGMNIINTLLYIFKSDSANYFIVQQHHTLSSFIEIMIEKNVEVQAGILKVVDYIIVEQKFVPTAELTSLGLLLASREYPQTISLCLNFFLRLISYRTEFKSIFREVGVLTMLINALKSYADDLQDTHELTAQDSHTPTSVSSPSLPLESIQGEDEECMFLLMECLRATIEGMAVNGLVFRESGGVACVVTLVSYKTPRRMALKLLRQLILLEDGSVDFNTLLDLLNQTPQTAINVKSEILQTVLGVFQLDSSKKALFREVSGFHYLISVLASLIGSLDPHRVHPWTIVPRSDILKLVQLLFMVMTCAMQDDPANRNFFERDIRYDSFSAPLLLLGCFNQEQTVFPEATHISSNESYDSFTLQTSGSFSTFEAEFKNLKQPGETLDENSYIYCMSEVFRFIRDMALDKSAPQSASLLYPANSERMLQREKSFYSSPPQTSKHLTTPNLVHAGAILLMIDLLPSVTPPKEENVNVSSVDGEGGNLNTSSLANDGTLASQVSLSSTSPSINDGKVAPQVSAGGLPTSPSANEDALAPQVLVSGLPRCEQSDSESLTESPLHKADEVFHNSKCNSNSVLPAGGKEVGLYGGVGLGHVTMDCGDDVVIPESVNKVKGEKDDECEMSTREMKKWCVFLQERVLSEIYNLSITERNQQALCQVGLPQRILMRCFGVVADETHPLHHALERTFEKLSYQALTPSDFRNFLRLGNPLCCSLNNISSQDLLSGKYSSLLLKVDESDETPNQNAPFGSSLSLARIQSLVTMTTSRDGYQPVVGGAPPFVEFDLSIDGFGCLFLPSIFPHSDLSNVQTTPSSLTLMSSGIGEGGRPFPPNGGGLTFTSWILISRYSLEDSPRLSLLSLSQTICTTDIKHYPCLLIYIKPSTQQIIVSTQLSPDVLLENIASWSMSEGGGDKKSETVFSCEELFFSQSWNHVAVVMQKPGLRGKAKVTLFINGQSVGTQRMSHVHILTTSSSLSAQSNESNPVMINAHIGTHVTQRHVSLLTYRLGPMFLFEEHLSSGTIHTIYKLGPSYFGSFQAPILQDASSLNSAHGNVLPPLVSEDKILFGLIATHPLIKTVQELGRLYKKLDVTAIQRELSLSEHDDITPVTLLHNTAVHLTGPSRTLGAIMCGYSGIRFFQPQPLRSLLSAVGGTKVVLGLVAMATTVDNLYASMKALVCIIGNNEVALKEMERTGGFKVLGMLLRSKSQLVNSNILHLTYTLVGTVDSGQESAHIPNVIAFKDLLADLAIWSKTSEDIQRSLFNHFFELLSHTSHKTSNAEQMLDMKMISLLLFRLIDETLTIRTIKTICNVISALLGISPRSDDLRRVGQLLATTLPSNQTINENSIYLYQEDEGSSEKVFKGAQFGRFHGDEGKHQRAIVLRNLLLDVFVSLLTRDMELNSQFARELYQSLGFDWLFLFMNATIHMETVVRAVRILVQLLCDSQLQQYFVNGDIFGGWVKGFDTISQEMTNLLVNSLTLLNPFPTTGTPTQQIPGPIILAHLLPNHSNLSQVYLLLSANMLGQQCIDIPFSARFDMETLEEVFSIGDVGVMSNYKISGNAACILLTVARALLHKDPHDRHLQENAVNLVKFFERLYKTLPEFTKLAFSPEFIEALVSALFPPLSDQDPLVSTSESDHTVDTMKMEEGNDDWIMIEAEVLGNSVDKEESNAILFHPNNLAVCTILKLLRTIAIDGFSSATPTIKDNAPSCPILERILASTPPGIGQNLVKQYQTLILQNMMDYLVAGNEDVMVLFQGGMLALNMERSLCGLHVFCSRLVDKVWHRYFLNPTHSIYSFLSWLIEQARRTPKQMPIMELQRSLNRLILFQVSMIPNSELEQKAFMDTLCMYSSQAHVIFDETNVDDQFLECLTYSLLRIALYEKMLVRNPLQNMMEDENSTAFSYSSLLHDRIPSGYIPGSLAMMKSGANRLWTKMLEYKKPELERLLEVDLPSPGDNHREMFAGQHMQVTLPQGNKTFLRLQNCQLFLHNKTLERAWKDFVSEQRSNLSMDSTQREGSISSSSSSYTLKKGAGIVATMASKVRRKRGNIVSKDALVHEFVSILSNLLILASQKFYELLLRKHQRNVEYQLRFAASEWKKIEYELTRERGLWGPDKPSTLDKWMVEIVEGPCRMRKRMQRNHLFYQQYPHQPFLSKAVKSKYQKPTSRDSELQAMRERLFQRPTILATPTHLTAVLRDNESAAKATDAPGIQQSSPAHFAPGSSSTRLDIFSHPDSDDPVTQTLYKMIEPDDKVSKQYQCARLTGLDSQDGVLLLGSTHFYVIEGLTITSTGEIIDIESAPEGSYEPVIPGSIHSHSNDRDKTNIPIQCIKLSYDTIREVHKRRYLLRHCAIEVFSSDGRSHFLIFFPKYRDKIYQRLLSLSKSSLTQGDSQFIAGIHPEMDPEHAQGLFSVLTGEKSLVEKWVNGEMSNFQYLMHLNTLAGRSYNDLMQYPIFPWVLADYTSQTLDLTNPATFRDLSKPMGAQSEGRLQRFIERYQYFEDPTGENTPPYYYGTHYSSAMIVASYLIRMEPFTQYFLKLQGGHFDLPDRLFHSIPDAWRSASETNMADIKELIPEFFYLPEFLVNSNNFELGTKQSGETLENIILPPWSKGDPHEFIRVHREALESDYVSSNLHKWIDLIFGYKQKGEEALANHNVFHHFFYEGAVDIDRIKDPMKKNAAISFIHNFGQMPKQLFKKPHRQRKISSVAVSQDTPTPPPTNLIDSQKVFYKNLVQLMPSREPVKIISGEVAQMVSPSDNKIPLAVDRNKIFLPWSNYRYYFMWGFPDHSARIAAVDTDRDIAVFEGLHQGRILCAAVADDTTLLTAGDSTVVCVWAIHHGGAKERAPTQLHLKHTLHGHTAPVCCLASSSSYNLIVSGSRDKTCILWDMTNFSFVRQLCDHSGPVTVVTINQLNGNIVSCTKNQIRLWTVNGTLLAETPLILTSRIKVLCCAMSELFDWDKENVVITGSSDGIVRMWALEYVSEEEILRLGTGRYGRGSPADSMLSETSGGVGGGVYENSGHLQDSENIEEKFRPTGQSKYQALELNHNSVECLSDATQVSPGDSNIWNHPNSTPCRTYSEETEEERTAGCWTDVLNEFPTELEGTNEKSSLPRPGDTTGDEKSDEYLSDGSHDTSHDYIHVSCDQEQTEVKGKTADDKAEINSEEELKEEEVIEKEELSELNPAYAKYMMEKRKEAEELRSKTGKWSRRLKLVHTLTMHTSFHRKDNEIPAAVTSLCISKDHRRLFVGDSIGRIFSWTVSDNLGGVMQHWVIDSAVNSCSKCGIDFSFTERKHHCRDCGQIFCARCSNYEIEVERLRIHKKVRVCVNCYDEITTERGKSIFRTPTVIDA